MRIRTPLTFASRYRRFLARSFACKVLARSFACKGFIGMPGLRKRLQTVVLVV